MKPHRTLVAVLTVVISIGALIAVVSGAGPAVETQWKIAPDGLTYTFKLRPGIRFHDGSVLTSADVKATYEKIVFPPAGVRSIRKNSYAAITSIDAPDANTIVFKLKHPS